MILLNVVMVCKKLPVSGSLWLGFGIITCNPCSLWSFRGCLCQYIFFLHVLSAAFLWYIPFSIMIYSLLGCLATLITDYSVCCLLPCNLAWRTFQGYILISFLFHLGIFPIPSSKVCFCLPSGFPYFLRVQCLSFSSLCACPAYIFMVKVVTAV